MRPPDDRTQQLIDEVRELHLNIDQMQQIIHDRYRIEDELRQNQYRLADAEHLAHLGSFEADFVNGSIIWSDENYRIHNWDPRMAPPTVKEYRDKFLFPADRDRYWDNFRRMKREHVPVMGEYRIVTPGGGIKWSEIIEHPIFDNKGNLVKSYGAILDITERKRFEQELRDSEERYRALVESSDDIIFQIKPDGRLIYINEAGLAPMKLSRSQMIGKRLCDLFPSEEAAVFLGEVKRVIEIGKPRQSEFTVNAKGRKIVFFNSVVPMIDKDGKVESIVGVSRDITARKQVEIEREQLMGEVQRRAAELNATVSAMADGLIIVGSRGEIVRFNKTAQDLLGYTSGEMRTKTPAERAKFWKEIGSERDTLSPDRLPAMRALHGEVLTSVRYTFHRPDGIVKHLQVSAGPIYDEHGQITGAVATLSDITELAELQQWQQQLTSIVAHDLRQPLTTIQGQAQITTRALDSGKLEIAKQSNEAVMISAKRMNSMIQDLVDSVRFETSHFELDLKSIGMAQFLADLLKRITPSMDISRVKLTVAPDLSFVSADPDRLERIMINLLSNALKYSMPGTPVEIRACRQGDRALIEVEDHGQGIAPEDIPHVFERFFSVRKTKKKESVGLGLYITKIFVEAHHGRLSVRSKPGNGSVFSFTLSLAEKPSS